MWNLVCICGISGSGKTTLTKYLSNKYKLLIPQHVTTREPRKDDNGFYLYKSWDWIKENYEKFLFWVI